MILELLTPLMLATSPQLSHGMTPTYNHDTQSVDGWKDSSKIVSAGQSTRTFDFQGKPNDSDWD
ncbi:MAG: hypothetical protein ORN50_06580 [Crocinitomicaceae bacterium]|nr:hypothetical protein [Crocinitomicaceae bacterium]